MSAAEGEIPCANAEEVRDIIKGVNKFGFGVMKLLKRDENFIFSPVSGYVFLWL